MSREELGPQPPVYYEIQAGDSLASIAQRELGCQRLAQAIARANGYPHAQSYVMPGEKIRIPVVERYTLQAGDEAVYAKVRAAIIGSIYPDLTIISPPQTEDEGFFGTVLKLFVPMVLSILLGPTGWPRR